MFWAKSQQENAKLVKKWQTSKKMKEIENHSYKITPKQQDLWIGWKVSIGLHGNNKRHHSDNLKLYPQLLSRHFWTQENWFF